MVVAIFYVITFFIEIVLILKSIIKKDVKWLDVSCKVNISILLSIILFVTYIIMMSGKFGDNNFILYVLSILVILVFYVPLLIINCIIKFIMKRRLRKLNIDNAVEKGKKFNVYKVMFCLVIIVLALDSIPYNIKMLKWNVIKEQTVEYLTLKYGDGDFCVEKMYDTEEKFDFSTSTSYKYVLTISSSYMDDEFEVTIDKEDLDISDENFLEIYYESSSFNIYDYYTEELINQLSENYNATISIHQLNINRIDTNYGYIPSLDELSIYTVIPEININKKMTSLEELREYITEVSAFYITELKKDYTTYSHKTAYIIFIYDNSNLGGLDSTTNITVRFLNDYTSINITYLDNTYSYDISELIYVSE